MQPWPSGFAPVMLRWWKGCVVYAWESARPLLPMDPEGCFLHSLASGACLPPRKQDRPLGGSGGM
eukprot:2434358-Prorocentrum_lima.AAC.1